MDTKTRNGICLYTIRPSQTKAVENIDTAACIIEETSNLKKHSQAGFEPGTPTTNLELTLTHTL